MEEWGCPSHAPRGGVSPVGHTHSAGSFPSVNGGAGGTQPGLAATSCLPSAERGAIPTPRGAWLEALQTL